MTFLVNFSTLSCLCTGGWIEVCQAQAFYLDLEMQSFCLGVYVCSVCKGIVYAHAEHLAFFLLGLIAFMAAASPLRHDRHTC